tara:strand:+ start:25 stop:405 length:381 start_codon:yes stop_codon:yes gene_type:complete
MQTFQSAKTGQPFNSPMPWQTGTVRFVEVDTYELILSFIRSNDMEIIQNAKELQNTGCPFLHIKDYQDNFYEVVGSETGIDLLEVLDKDGNKFEVQPYDDETDTNDNHGIPWQEEYFDRYVFRPMA